MITQRPVQRQVGKHQPRRTVVQRVKRQALGRTRRPRAATTQRPV
ncbi:hypothetical protein [Limosilactobacillus reuteri]|nr:hypothetical protein [Limosilactobacillus reuteri]